MSILRLALCCVVLGGLTTLVSCKKKSTPADKIEATTSSLEDNAAAMKKEATKLEASVADKATEAKKTELPKAELPK